MAWNYRKRIKIFPGVTINVSKGGLSTSIGKKGRSVTVGRKGTHLNLGIPGTGLYYRHKLSSSPTKETKHSIMGNNRTNGKNSNRFSWGIAMLLLFVVAISMILTKSMNDVAQDCSFEIVLSCILLIVILVLFQPWLKSNNNDSDDELIKSGTIHSRSSKETNKYGYDYVIDRYIEEEHLVISKSEEETERVRQLLNLTNDSTKCLFLQSYIDCCKYDNLNRLINFYHYNIDEHKEQLDPLFEKAAYKVVAAQSFQHTSISEWFGYSLEYNRCILLEQQLMECGIIKPQFVNLQIDVLISDYKTLKAILKQTNGKTLLTKEDKIKINEFLSLRKSEIIGSNAIKKTLAILPDHINELYVTFIEAYKSLIKCNAKWEIISSQDNSEYKSSISTLVDRRPNYGSYQKSYNFLDPLPNVNAAHFRIQGTDIFIYPEYVVVAREEQNFDVIPISKFNMTFARNNFIEESTSLLPNDAKFVRHTYKYVNRNGKRDARYSDNPVLGVYEYGKITFGTSGLEMQFSNSDATDYFFHTFQTLKQKSVAHSEFLKVTELHFNNSQDVAKAMEQFYCKLANNKIIMETVDSSLSDEMGGKKEKLQNLFLSDMVKCYDTLGHDSTNLYDLESIPLILLESYIVSRTNISFETIQSTQIKNVIDSLCKINESIRNAFLKNVESDYFFINEILKSCGSNELVVQYFSLLYRFFSIVAKADGTVNEKESRWLEKIMDYSRGDSNSELAMYEKIAGVNTAKENEEQCKREISMMEIGAHDPMVKLQSLIGLDEVKKEVSALANFVRIQKEREKNGLKAIGLSYHCVFTGNPGTGKTTVARIVAEIYKNLGLLKKGHLVETDRSGLVAEYVGQTAVKTNKIIDSAIDGVLFIDEAYSLVQSGNNDYGNEAISTLLKRMEDDRDRLVVILAGYGKEMIKFIDSNPGLQSRFNRYIHFDDYGVEELKHIYLQNANSCQYKLTSEAVSLLARIITEAVEQKDKNFGNGRFVRNLFERTIQNQAVRLSRQGKINAAELSTIVADDIPLNKCEL